MLGSNQYMDLILMQLSLWQYQERLRHPVMNILRRYRVRVNPTFTLVNVSALLGVALFSSVLAYIFWNRGVDQVGASVAGLFVHLMPVFGTILAWIFLGERLHAYHALGIAFILTGIYVTSRGAARVIAVPLE